MKLDRDRNNTNTKRVLGTEDSCEGEQGGGGLCRRTRGEKEKWGHLPLSSPPEGLLAPSSSLPRSEPAATFSPSAARPTASPGCPRPEVTPNLLSEGATCWHNCPAVLLPTPPWCRRLGTAGDTVPPPGWAAGEIAGIASAQVVLTPPAACNCQQRTLPDKFAARCFPSCCPGEVKSPIASRELFRSKRCWFLTRLLG